MMWTAGKCFSDGTNILSTHSNNTQKRTVLHTVTVINTEVLPWLILYSPKVLLDY